MGYHMTCYRRFVALSKAEQRKMLKVGKLERQSCENNVQISEKHSSNTNYEVNHKISKTLTKHRNLSKGFHIL